MNYYYGCENTCKINFNYMKMYIYCWVILTNFSWINMNRKILGNGTIIVLRSIRGWIVWVNVKLIFIYRCVENEVCVSVSYTHLDVYKRQVISRGGLLLHGTSKQHTLNPKDTPRTSTGECGMARPYNDQHQNQQLWTTKQHHLTSPS